ncbi:TPA: alpha/beta fold hydrolase [Pseudomonas aeruginosa]
MAPIMKRKKKNTLAGWELNSESENRNKLTIKILEDSSNFRIEELYLTDLQLQSFYKTLMKNELPRSSQIDNLQNAPNLSESFRKKFYSSYTSVNGIQIHAVIGGKGHPLLLICGWPQCWYAWRHIMEPLAENYQVIAVDPRGMGCSTKSLSGYDAETLAMDMFDLMDKLGHPTFSLVTHDIGVWTGYIMAIDSPRRVRTAIFGEAFIPGLSASPPLIPQENGSSSRLWHFNFNREKSINEELISGKEIVYFTHQFSTKAATSTSIPNEAVDFYIKQLETHDSLKASFGPYRALDKTILQIEKRKNEKLKMPILSYTGEAASNLSLEQQLSPRSTQLESLILKDCGHYPAEEKPSELLIKIKSFLKRKL